MISAMNEGIINFLHEINLVHLVIIGLMLYLFFNRLNKKIYITRQEIAVLTEKVDNLDRRLCRIEGSLASMGLDEY